MDKKVEDLKAKILEAQKNFDIAALYILEKEAHDVFDEATLSGYYANILDMALENLTTTLESHRKMDMKSATDYTTVRALYEYAMEHYSAGAISDASALFEVLSGLSDDRAFSQAMKFHWISSKENIKLDDFLESIADVEETQKAKTFYISRFKTKAQNLLDNAK